MNSVTLTSRTIRAIAVFIGKKALKTSLIILVIILALLITGIYFLASSISVWWWILLLPITVATFVIFLVYSFVNFILLKTYPHQFTKEQLIALQKFINKLTNLNETRSTPMFFIVTKTIWEIIRYKEAKTIKYTIEHSKTMKPDFERLTSFFDF